MTVATVLAAFKTLHSGISGVKSAPAGVQASINAAQLPYVETIPQESEWNTQAIGMRRQYRVYSVRVYVAPVAAGKGLAEGWTKCVALLEAFGQAYIAAPTLSGAVDHIGGDDTRITDTGITVLEHAGVTYHGFEYRVPVTDKVII